MAPLSFPLFFKNRKMHYCSCNFLTALNLSGNCISNAFIILHKFGHLLIIFKLLNLVKKNKKYLVCDNYTQ